MTSKVERERRFLLRRLPDCKDSEIKNFEITQSYIEKNSHQVRLRKIFDYSNLETKYYLTHKTKGEVECIETECLITEEIYNLLFPMTVNRVIRKVRYKLDGWEIDKFVGMHSGLVIAEFESLENFENFDLTIPDWLKDYIVVEITGDSKFSNSNLAK